MSASSSSTVSVRWLRRGNGWQGDKRTERRLFVEQRQARRRPRRYQPRRSRGSGAVGKLRRSRGHPRLWRLDELVPTHATTICKVAGLGLSRRDHSAQHAALRHAGAQPLVCGADAGQEACRAGRTAKSPGHGRPQRGPPPAPVQARLREWLGTRGAAAGRMGRSPQMRRTAAPVPSAGPGRPDLDLAGTAMRRTPLRGVSAGLDGTSMGIIRSRGRFQAPVGSGGCPWASLA